MIHRLLPVALLSACGAGFRPVPGDQFCLEAGYAIAAVTESCTGDRPLANRRFEAFQEQTDCVRIDVTEPPGGVQPEQLFDCAFAIQSLPCDVVSDFGDDIDAYLAISPACALVTDPAGGAP